MNNVIKVLEIIVPIFAMILLGVAAKKRNKISEEASKGLQQFVVTFCLPCVLFNWKFWSGIHYFDGFIDADGITEFVMVI